MTHNQYRLAAVPVRQGERHFLLCAFPVKLLAYISYASIRGYDAEEGAIQRVLNPRRITSIKAYTLQKGDYPTSVVLNWTNTQNPLTHTTNEVLVPYSERSAQLIDGQHRVAGLRAAMEENPAIGELEIPVALFEHLNTADCASIFLSINTEQKPVPRSLVFDLYGIVDENIADAAAVRARDIVLELNQEIGSAYYEQIKLPGSPRRRGGIALSTAVTAIKPLVEEKGDFEQRGIADFEIQKQVISNYFNALKDRYGQKWDTKENAFMYASGFIAAVDFLRIKLLSYGHTHKSYTQKTFYDVIQLVQNDLIMQEEVKGKGGKDAPQIILERLNQYFHPRDSASDNFEV